MRAPAGHAPIYGSPPRLLGRRKARVPLCIFSVQ